MPKDPHPAGGADLFPGILCGLIRLCRRTAFAFAICGGELSSREGDPGENLTRIFGAAGIVTALLGGNGIIQHRHDDLGVPLQPDDGELPQRHQQSALFAAENQLVVKMALHLLRDLQRAWLGG